MLKKYIPLSEYNKSKDDPLVCSVCGNKQDEQCCSITHHAQEEMERTGSNFVAVWLVCSCPRCAIGT